MKANRGKAKSLNSVINDNDYPLIKYGIKSGNYNIGCSQNIITLPNFMLFLLKDILTHRNNTKLGEWIKTHENKIFKNCVSIASVLKEKFIKGADAIS